MAKVQDFTSKLVDQQTAECADIQTEIAEVMNDPQAGIVEKAQRVRMLNHQYEVRFMIMQMLVKAEEERMRKIFE
jgi:hypothetical protein